MGRRRASRQDEHLPERVYRERKNFVFRPKGGGYIKLCPIDTPTRDIWEAYDKARTNFNRYTVAQLITDFELSPEYKERALATQKDYRNSAKNIGAVFGTMEPSAVTRIHVRKYMDLRGNTSKVRANRERSYIMALYTWGSQRDASIKENPAKGVTPFKEKARVRYVTDQEYIATYDIAPPMIQVAMDIAYLCAARQSDVLSIIWGQPGQTKPDKDQAAVILEQGIYIRQGKTGKAQIKLWTPALKKAISQAKKENDKRKSKSRYVISTKSASRYTTSGFKSVWVRVRNKALEDNLISESFTFHDLKAKGITDYNDGDKQEFSGHTSRTMMEKYNRGIQEVNALNPKKKDA